MQDVANTRLLPSSGSVWLHRLPCTYIGSSTGVLCMHIRCSFDDDFRLEACRCQIRLHLIDFEEHKIECHRLVPPFIKMDAVLPNVEREQEHATRAQHAL